LPMRNRLVSAKQLRADPGAVDPVNQSSPHPAVFEEWVVQIQIDMFVDQSRFVLCHEVFARAEIEGERFVDR